MEKGTKKSGCWVHGTMIFLYMYSEEQISEDFWKRGQNPLKFHGKKDKIHVKVVVKTDRR